MGQDIDKPDSVLCFRFELPAKFSFFSIGCLKFFFALFMLDDTSYAFCQPVYEQSLFLEESSLVPIWSLFKVALRNPVKMYQPTDTKLYRLSGPMCTS